MASLAVASRPSLTGTSLQKLDISHVPGYTYYQADTLPASPGRANVISNDRAYFRFNNGMHSDLLLLSVYSTFDNQPQPSEIEFRLKRDDNKTLWTTYMHLALPLVLRVIESMPETCTLIDDDNILNYVDATHPYLYAHLLQRVNPTAKTPHVYVRLDSHKQRAATPAKPIMAIQREEAHFKRQLALVEQHKYDSSSSSARVEQVEDTGLLGFLQARKIEPRLEYSTYLRRVQQQQKRK